MPLLAPAFPNPVLDAQSAFRSIMEAMARPGIVKPFGCDLSPPEPLSAGMAAVALTLFDYDTPIYLDEPFAGHASVTEWLRFHTGARIVEAPERAAFALIGRGRPLQSIDSFNLGDAEYPDQSATIVIDVGGFDGAQKLRLSGPGVSGARVLAPDPLPDGFLDQRALNDALFPRGVDFLFVSPAAVAAVPRSSRVLSEV